MRWWRSRHRRPNGPEQWDAEVRFHIDKLTEEHLAAGLPPGEARRRAMLEFGGVEQVKEAVHDVHRSVLVDQLTANLKVALRLARKSPGFTLVAVLTLALGIGANSAVFSAIDAILLRPLPFPESHQLVRLGQRSRQVRDAGGFVAPARLEDWNRLSSAFQAITGHYTESASELSGALPEKLTRAWVAPRFLQVWGTAPALGRDFSPAEERFGGPRAALISDRLWRRRFSADPGALGQDLRFGQLAWTVVGVMPASFRFPDAEVDLWSPSPVDAPFAQSRESTWFVVVGRLKPGITVAQARTNLDAVQHHLGRDHPKTDADLSVAVQPLKDTIVGDSRRSLWLLFGSVSLLLLIACTNISALLLARAAHRRQEIAVRVSLGASRASLVGQLLTETLVLALVGAALGLALAVGAATAFRVWAEGLPRVGEIGVDGRLVAYSLACAVVTTLLCGLAPAFQSTRRGLSEPLAQRGRTQAAGGQRMQWLLVGLQVSLAVTLLSGAGLLLRSLQALGRVSPGFEPDRVLTFHVSASWGETTNRKGLEQRVDRTLAALRSLPGVEAAATSAALPGVPASFPTELTLAGARSSGQEKVVAESRWVSPGYFDVMRVPLLAGEPCREAADPVASVVVNRSFVNAYLHGVTAIGREVRLSGNSPMPPGRIDGIAGDARETGLHREPSPTVYWCGSAPLPDPHYLVRTRAQPQAMTESVRRKLRELEPGRAVFGLQPLERHLGQAFAEGRLRTLLLAFFAITAVSLACLGLYGTLSYLVQVRQREIGVRLALGALRSQIVGQFVRQGMGVALAGCAAGLGLALALGRVLAGMLFGVSATDAPTLAAVIGIVAALAAVASLVPAIRAARLDAVRVLREE